MFNTFNMGVGLVLVVGKEDADKALEVLKDQDAFILGELTGDDEPVVLL